MAEEFLDIIDENNNLTGESFLRSKVHAEGLWHRTVHIYLFRKNNQQIEFLVHLRSKFKDCNPNKWGTSFGGHITTGASLEEAVKTEMQEEIGLDVDLEKLVGGYWCKRDNNPDREFTMRYGLEYNGALENLKFNDGEVQAIKWMSVSEIQESIQQNPKTWAGRGTSLTEMVGYIEKAL